MTKDEIIAAAFGRYSNQSIERRTDIAQQKEFPHKPKNERHQTGRRLQPQESAARQDTAGDAAEGEPAAETPVKVNKRAKKRTQQKGKPAGYCRKPPRRSGPAKPRF